MNGTGVIGGGSLGNPGPSWHVAGDGAPYRALTPICCGRATARDLSPERQRRSLYLGDWWRRSAAAVSAIPGRAGTSRRSGDFNGDGSPDLLWQNDSGEAAVWETDGAAVTAGASLGNPGPSWHIVAAGDFNHDGRSDILWQNEAARRRFGRLDGAR